MVFHAQSDQPSAFLNKQEKTFNRLKNAGAAAYGILWGLVRGSLVDNSRVTLKLFGVAHSEWGLDGVANNISKLKPSQLKEKNTCIIHMFTYTKAKYHPSTHSFIKFWHLKYAFYQVTEGYAYYLWHYNVRGFRRLPFLITMGYASWARLLGDIPARFESKFCTLMAMSDKVDKGWEYKTTGRAGWGWHS